MTLFDKKRKILKKQLRPDILDAITEQSMVLQKGRYIPNGALNIHKRIPYNKGNIRQNIGYIV